MITPAKYNEWKTTLLQPMVLVTGAVLVGLFLFFYQSTILYLIRTYWNEPDYNRNKPTNTAPETNTIGW